MQSTKKKKKEKNKYFKAKYLKIFWTKKGYITCSKLMINELARSPTRLENVNFSNNEQALIAVFTAVLFYTCQTSFNLT